MASAPKIKATAKGPRRKPHTETPLARATTSSSLRDRPRRLRSAPKRKAKGSADVEQEGHVHGGETQPEHRVEVFLVAEVEERRRRS